MRRTAALTVSLALLLAGCSSGNAADPAPTSTSSTATSASAAASSGGTSSAAATAVPADLATWASAFCTAAAPLTTLGSLPTPDTSSPAAAKTSLTAFYRQGAAVFTEAATALSTVGPPPVGGDSQLTQGAVDALSGSATRFQGLATAAEAADPSDAAAIGGLVSGFSDAIAALQASFASLNQGQSPEVSAAITAAPECAALAR
ncbi:hypothetical protein RHODO2019_15130 [Rhodococcus antarcticus]|uniref:Uncharacterized protein n=1 Tax=Rhodococcus antarcticus TaxID=2987751 RepID=A0ABY6NZC2_9NOCA|nr:hypothetical protein [Rhodococcus antarcticus]UZJ24456.1 hypothetical protein RHODO2019_15130 [Rhodococcus antarcticus]